MAIDPKKARAALAKDFKGISVQTFGQRLDRATPAWATPAKKKSAKKKTATAKGQNGAVFVSKKAAAKKGPKR